ncbi:hypothetical protein FACS1894109_17400 [Spirochaetia bacterium]|nr:hypothetical protein FACS1894109_17400 [Spirochaetia bacterium]
MIDLGLFGMYEFDLSIFFEKFLIILGTAIIAIPSVILAYIKLLPKSKSTLLEVCPIIEQNDTEQPSYNEVINLRTQLKNILLDKKMTDNELKKIGLNFRVKTKDTVSIEYKVRMSFYLDILSAWWKHSFKDDDIKAQFSFFERLKRFLKLVERSLFFENETDSILSRLPDGQPFCHQLPISTSDSLFWKNLYVRVRGIDIDGKKSKWIKLKFPMFDNKKIRDEIIIFRTDPENKLLDKEYAKDKYE